MSVYDWSEEESEAYMKGELDFCHLCSDAPAVTSDGVCSSCAEKYPRSPKTLSEIDKLRSEVEKLRKDYDESKREVCRLTKGIENIERELQRAHQIIKRLVCDTSPLSKEERAYGEKVAQRLAEEDSE